MKERLLETLRHSDDRMLSRVLDSCHVQRARVARQYRLDSVYHVPTIDSLQRVAPETLFARLHRYHSELRGRLGALPRDPDEPSRKLIGSVAANDTLAFVVVHEYFPVLPFPGWSADRTEVYTARRVGSQWLVELDGQLGEISSFMEMYSGDCEPAPR